MASTSGPSGAAPTPGVISARRPRGSALGVTAAATIGSAVLFYDSFLSGSAAALVYPANFFSGAPPALASALSLATYATTLVVSLLGAILWGHVGDRYSRRTALLYTLVVMAIAMLGIAVLPTYSAIGVVSPVMLILFTILIGIGGAGELGGSTSWIVESASTSRFRAMWAAWPAIATAIGSVLAAAAFSGGLSYFGYMAFITTDWRILYGVGATVALAGIFMRFGLPESPLLVAEAAKKALDRIPLADAFRHNWKMIVLLSFTLLISFVNVIIGVEYGISYMTVGLGINEAIVTAGVAIGTAVSVPIAVLSAYLADRYGRRRIILVAGIFMIICIAPYFVMMTYKTVGWISLAYFILLAPELFANGAYGAFFPENFPTRYRYTATGLLYGFTTLWAGILGAFLIPGLVAFAGGVGNALPYLVVLAFILPIAGLISLAFTRETRGIDLTKG